jgi:PAS domain S-box-containing protein
METQMTFPGSASPKLRFVAAAAAFATLYFVTAELTSSLTGDVGIAVLWPASGVYLGLMLVAPRQLWPALALGAGLGSLAAYAHAGSSLELSVAFAIPSSAEGLLGAVMIERIVRGRFRLGGLRDVSALVIGSAIATALVALSAGAVAAQTYGVSFAESWLRWWSADALGVLAFAPLVVALVHSRGERPAGAELRFCAGVIAVGALAVWAQPTGTAAMAGGALVLPVFLWAGWRWGPRAAAVGGTAVALAAMNLAADSNLLGGGTVDSEIHVLQAFLAALLVSSLSFAAAVADGRVEHVAAVRTSRRLRAITDSSPDAYVTVDSEGLITGWSARAQAMFGITADEVSGRSLESIAPGAGPVTPTPDARELTLLARHRSGREFPAALTVRPGIDGDDGLWHVFIRDLTESERLGKELDRAAEEAERRARARDDARTKLRGTARELERANRRIGELTAALEQRDDELAETTRALRAEQQDLQRMMRTHARATAERDDAQRDLAATASERDAARRELEAASAKHDQVLRELEGASAEREKVRRSLEVASGERDTVRRELQAASEELDDARRTAAAAAAERDEARQTAAATAAERDEARRNLERGARETERLRADLVRTGGDMSRVRTELTTAAGELARERAARRALEEQLERAGTENARMSDELHRTRAEHARMSDELERFAAEHARTRARIEELEDELATADAERALVGEHGRELIARYDERGVCLAASAGTRGLLGYEPEELVGRPGADLIHPEDRARLLRARAAQAEVTFRARLRNRAGEYIPVEVDFRPDGGEGGRLGEVTTVARPIAERRSDDDAGRVAETRFRSLFGTLPHASALIGPDGRIVRANLALARLTGYSGDQLEGTALGTLVHDADAAVFGGRLRQVATGHVASLQLEQRLAHASGRTVPVELKVTPLPANGDARFHELVVHFEDLGRETRLTSAVA